MTTIVNNSIVVGRLTSAAEQLNECHSLLSDYIDDVKLFFILEDIEKAREKVESAIDVLMGADDELNTQE